MPMNTRVEGEFPNEDILKVSKEINLTGNKSHKTRKSLKLQLESTRNDKMKNTVIETKKNSNR